jgi:hypothetical protein
MNYYEKKTEDGLNHAKNKEQGKQLFSKDKNSKMSKEYFYSTYEEIYKGG